MDSNTNNHANEELDSQVYRIDYDPYSTEMAETKQEDTIIEDLELPWKRAAKDPSIIQKGTELFVGSLSIETEERDLYEMFKECGEVIDIRIHRNPQTRKCYAFIRMLSKEMLRYALEKNNYIIRGRKIKVTKSNENSTIFLGNIRKNWTNQEVELKFPNSEKIEHFPDSTNQCKNRGFCFVVFKSRNEALKALNYVNNKGGINIDGIPITCDWADVVDEDDNSSKQIFLSGLNEDVEECTLREIFQEYGNITEIVLSRLHKTTKRRDLAFIAFDTHSEAKQAVDEFRSRIDTDPSLQPLGDKITVSLAFSQQAMQNKKKIKESRKKPQTIHPTIISHPNIVSIPTTIQPIPPIENNNMNSAMLAMMNLINLNKNNVNISPQLMGQMMSACLESIMNQQNQTPTVHNNLPYHNLNPLNNYPTLNSFSSLNPINLNQSQE